MSVQLKVPENIDEKEPLYAVQFTNGHLESSALRVPKFKLFNKTNDRTKKRRVVVANTDQMTYFGMSHSSDSTLTPSRICKYYIGIHDPSSSNLTLHKAELLTLTPYIPENCQLEPTEVTPTKVDRRQSLKALVSSFGSEKQKRAVTAAERNRVDPASLDAVLATAVTHARGEAEKAAEEPSVPEGSLLVPRHNPDAQTPQDVYNLGDIITDEELRALKREAKVFTEVSSEELLSWKTNQMYPKFVLCRIPLLPSHEPNRTLKASILLYICYLFEMYHLKNKEVQKHGVVLTCTSPPPVVMERLVASFAENTSPHADKPSYVISQRMKDKVLSHLFALLLMLDNFSVDCAELQKDFELTSSKLVDHFRALGCSITKKSASRSKKSELATPSETEGSCKAELKIPLNFPVPRKRKRKTAML